MANDVHVSKGTDVLGLPRPADSAHPPSRDDAIRILKGIHTDTKVIDRGNEWNDIRKHWPNWVPDLTDVDLRGANLSLLDLSRAVLKDAKMQNATLCGTLFSGANLRGADLSNSEIVLTSFDDADLTGASLKEVLCIKTDFTRATLNQARLEGATFSGAHNLRLDGNCVRDFRFPPKFDEAWTNVRRAYTGTKFFLHLLLLTVFFGGMGLRAVMWLWVNKAQTAVVEASKRLDAAASQALATNPDASAAMSHAAQELNKVTATFTEETRTYQIWQVLLGLDRGSGPCSLAVILLLYNVGRGWLTYSVGAMREEEERTGYAPFWKDYKLAWCFHHYAMRWLIFIAGLSFVYHAFFWLTAKVVLPG